MKTKWNIICDSSCDLTQLIDLAPDCTFNIAPLKILIGDNNYVDDAALDRSEFIKAMSTNKSSSASTCPAPFDWLEHFEKAENNIVITISSQLSGSYNSAIVARDMYLEKYPSGNVHILNSRSVSGSMILLATKANSLIKNNLSFDEVVNELEKYAQTMQLVFCLENYNTLIKNGRMNPLLGTVATALKIRAIAVKTPNGDINVISKQRGEQPTYKYMVNYIKEHKNIEDLTVYISHCNNPNGAYIIKNLLGELGCNDVNVIETRGLCSFYANIGGIIVSY